MKITVFTPTYNRAYIIEKLYHSLQRQTFRDFEWLIVDDGSSDNTAEVVAAWQQEGNDFPIRYYKKENGGKCRAINYGVDRAKGDLFFNVDSDDYLLDDALEKIDLWERGLPKNGKYCGVVGNLGTSVTETPNTPWPEPYRDANLLERYPEASDHPIDGERAWVFYTDIQKQYKYPEFKGENFITPAVTWNRMAHDGYLVRIYDDIIWVYEYQPDGLTASGNERFLRRPQGHGLWLREKAEFMNDSIVKKMKMWYTFYCDHTFCEKEYQLTKKQCADYIGAPRWFMYLAAAVHCTMNKIKRARGKFVAIHPLLSIQVHYQNFKGPHFKWFPEGWKLRRFKDKYKDQICFILGNGPSLCTKDLERLDKAGIVTFATNRIYNIFPNTTWRPTYYVCEDPYIIREKQEEIRAVPAKEKFIPIELKWYHGVSVPGAAYFHINYRAESVNKFGFSPDIAKEVVNRGTVTFACMEIAAYMGFSKIYLLGVDHNYQVTIDIDGNVITDPTAKDYFCEGYDDDIKQIAVHNMGQNTRAYLGAKGYSESTGNKFAIYNATRGGKLEVFERVNFDEIVK